MAFLRSKVCIQCAIYFLRQWCGRVFISHVVLLAPLLAHGSLSKQSSTLPTPSSDRNSISLNQHTHCSNRLSKQSHFISPFLFETLLALRFLCLASPSTLKHFQLKIQKLHDQPPCYALAQPQPLKQNGCSDCSERDTVWHS